jgi:hypothetical protein
MRANRAITRQEAHYTRHQRSSACLDYAPTRLERASVSSANRTRSQSLRPSASFGSGSEFTWSRSDRSAGWLLPRISRVGKTSPSRLPTCNTRTANLEGSSCAVVTREPSVSPSEELVSGWRHHWDQRLSLPKRFPNRRAIHLGRDWQFCLPSDLVWGLFTKAASVGMKCWEPKPNSQRIGVKALSVWMGGMPDHHLRPVTCDFLLTNTRLERLMRQSSEPRL